MYCLWSHSFIDIYKMHSIRISGFSGRETEVTLRVRDCVHTVGVIPPCLHQSVMNMMHVICIPYSLMKVNPLSWIQKVCQYKGQCSNSSPLDTVPGPLLDGDPTKPIEGSEGWPLAARMVNINI